MWTFLAMKKYLEWPKTKLGRCRIVRKAKRMGPIYFSWSARLFLEEDFLARKETPPSIKRTHVHSLSQVCSLGVVFKLVFSLLLEQRQ